MFGLDFDSQELQFPCHPRNQGYAARIQRELEGKLTEHFLIFSSGTTSTHPKGYALSREALFNNARSVNEHFELGPQDKWALSLPHYHVGGLSVLARAHLLGLEVVDCSGPWHPEHWTKTIDEKKVTITTVVPTQMHDLVQLGIRSPASLRFLVVGGDHLSAEMERRALELGWPVIRTFGMTEVCSQLASAKAPGEKNLVVMPHHQVKVDEDSRLLVKSTSLFTLQFMLKEELEVTPLHAFCDGDGFFRTSDLARIEGNVIEPLGRMDDQIKVSGRLIKLSELKDLLAAFALKHGRMGKLELQVEQDERHGKTVVVMHLQNVLNASLEEELSQAFLPVRPNFKEVPFFSRTELGKLKKQ